MYNRRVAELETYSRPLIFRCFQTSIWDETLYKAWSQIVHELISNAEQLNKSLNEFADVTEADEILLFEKKTFLVKYYKFLN
jgi:Ras-related GTP-binding protein A/B